MDCMVTSGFNFEGYKITKYGGLVTSRQIYSGISFAKRNDKSDESWDKAIADGISELKSKAAKCGSNAIIGAHLECVNSSTIVVMILSGTSVTIEPI